MPHILLKVNWGTLFDGFYQQKARFPSIITVMRIKIMFVLSFSTEIVNLGRGPRLSVIVEQVTQK